MSALNLSATMDAIAQRILAAGVTAKSYGWPVDSATSGSAIVGYPESIDFDQTFGRGSDKAVFPVWIIMGNVSDRTARDALSLLITGAQGIKDALDGTLGGAVQICQVTNCEISEIVVGGVSYLSAKFSLEIYS